MKLHSFKQHKEKYWGFLRILSLRDKPEKWAAHPAMPRLLSGVDSAPFNLASSVHQIIIIIIKLTIVNTHTPSD